jgi:hypothetical protein
MDRAWWLHHRQGVERDFAGERCSRARLPVAMRVTYLDKMQHYNNSGAAAVSLAAYRGARRVIMLGYDCQYTGGQKHWHGDHPPTLGNAKSCHKWADSFRNLAGNMAKRGVEVINCSRTTALDCFPRAELETALETPPE